MYENARTLTRTAFLVAALRSSPPSAGAARAAKERMEREKGEDDELDAVAIVAATADSSVTKPHFVWLPPRRAAASTARRSMELREEERAPLPFTRVTSAARESKRKRKMKFEEKTQIENLLNSTSPKLLRTENAPLLNSRFL